MVVAELVGTACTDGGQLGAWKTTLEVMFPAWVMQKLKEAGVGNRIGVGCGGGECLADLVVVLGAQSTTDRCCDIFPSG